MSRADADRWAADSAYKGTLYHATELQNVESLKANGWDLTRVKFGKLFGDGAYMAEDAAGVEKYVRDSSNGVALKTKVNVESIYEYNMGTHGLGWKDHPLRARIFAEIDGGLSRQQAITKVLTGEGYHALRVLDSRGGNFMVVFDPKRITILDD